MTPRNFLVRGLAAGLLAGLLTFVVAYAVGEPQVDQAISLEQGSSADAGKAETDHEHSEATSSGHSHDEGGTVVPRDNQSTWGLLTGTLAVSMALGGTVGLLSAFAVGRFGKLRPEQTTGMVAGIGFVSVALVPFLKYPANPPAVGDPDTIGARSIAYFILLAISIVAAAAATQLGRRLARTGAYRAAFAAVGAYVVLMVVAGTALPTINEIGDFPGDTLWYFRRASLVTLTTMWLSIGVFTATLIHRLHHREAIRTARRELAAIL